MTMRYISLDIETTGLDPRDNQILEIAVVVETGDLSTPVEKLPHKVWRFHHEYMSGSIVAFAMNARLITEIATNKESCCGDYQTAFAEIAKIAKEHGTKNIAGKNFGTFDSRFLDYWGFSERLQYTKRVIDPAMLYVDWDKDETLPDTKTCLQRAGLEPPKDIHDALSDARTVIRLIRHKQQNQFVPVGTDGNGKIVCIENPNKPKLPVYDCMTLPPKAP